MNPEILDALQPYYFYWLHYMSVPTIACSLLLLTLVAHLKRKAIEKEAKKFDYINWRHK